MNIEHWTITDWVVLRETRCCCLNRISGSTYHGNIRIICLALKADTELFRCENIVFHYLIDLSDQFSWRKIVNKKVGYRSHWFIVVYSQRGIENEFYSPTAYDKQSDSNTIHGTFFFCFFFTLVRGAPCVGAVCSGTCKNVCLKQAQKLPRLKSVLYYWMIRHKTFSPFMTKWKISPWSRNDIRKTLST